MKKNYLYLLVAFSFTINLFSQEKTWVDMMSDPNANFYDVQKAFYEYWKTHDSTEKGNGYKPFKRWEHFVQHRVYPTGDLKQLQLTPINFQKWLDNENSANQNSNAKFNQNMQTASATWTAIGPMGAMTGSANGLPRKAGRDNFVTIHQTNTLTMWVGAPAGGLWKTTNGGNTWTTATDNLSVIGASDLAYDPTNANILYLATGDGDAGDTPSIGVLKSTDGGTTWNSTGLTFAVANGYRIRRLIINPSNPQILLAATNGGMYRTTNGGANWSSVTATNLNMYDVEFKPGNPNIVYATSNTAFYKSTNGGASFTVISSGIPTSGANRLAVAVTPQATGYVYVLRSNTSSAFGGLYRSTNDGTNFTLMSSSPNILGNSCNNTSSGGQGWYDLALAVSPINANEVVIGGVNHHRSTNGGANWTCIGCWNSTASNPPYVHADVHDLDYAPNGTLFSANDGGIYRYTGTAWTDITQTRNIAQIYKIGTSALSTARWMTGHQDNGSNLYTGSSYIARYAGDGMDCFIDRTNDNNLFCETYNGNHLKSTNGGNSWTGATTGITQGGLWVTPWKQDPVSSNVLYSGRTTLFKSTNQGTSWSALSATGGSGGIIEFAIAPSNNQVIYVLHATSIRKTTNGGSSWTNVTSTLPLTSVNPEFIVIKPTDPNTAWVVCSGYSNGNKVFKTTNGGSSWTNVSANLPNIPANCAVYEPGSNDMIYVGMDVGVYYRDNSMGTWTLYNQGLPNVPLADMEISPANPTKIRAATYGRGVWEVDVYAAAPPVTTFSIAAANYCSKNNLQFNSNSTNGATAWSWTVTPSAGVIINTSTSQNPTIYFTNSGNYQVAVQASNSAGPGNISSQNINVLASPNINIGTSTNNICAGTTVTLTATGATSYSWSNGGGSSSSATFAPSSTTIYSVTGTTSPCSATQTISINTTALPNVLIGGSTFICNGTSATLNVTGATTYTWNNNSNATSIVVSPTVNTTYSVTGTGSGNCKNTDTHLVTVLPKPNVQASVSSTIICQGETATLTASGANSYTWNPGNLVGPSVIAGPASNTTYTVTGKDNSGCENTAIITLNVSTCTGLVKINNQLVNYRVFPNPTKDDVIFSLMTDTEVDLAIEVIDVTGKIITNKAITFNKNSREVKFDVSSISNGVYYMVLKQNDKALETIKLIKE
ncbi:MAG: T9SS type A sorting domain-containing protein [Bacteroidia bacterium]